MTPGRLTSVVFAVAALALGVAACGDDTEDVDISVPSIEVPSETTPPPSTPTSTTGTTTEPTGTGTTPPDSPATDVQPPAGSPQSKFEDFCKKNPGACG